MIREAESKPVDYAAAGSAAPTAPESTPVTTVAEDTPTATPRVN